MKMILLMQKYEPSLPVESESSLPAGLSWTSLKLEATGRDAMESVSKVSMLGQDAPRVDSSFNDEIQTNGAKMSHKWASSATAFH